MIDILEDAAFAQVGIVEDFFDGLDRPTGDIRLTTPAHDFVFWMT